MSSNILRIAQGENQVLDFDRKIGRQVLAVRTPAKCRASSDQKWGRRVLAGSLTESSADKCWPSGRLPGAWHPLVKNEAAECWLSLKQRAWPPSAGRLDARQVPGIH